MFFLKQAVGSEIFVHRDFLKQKVFCQEHLFEYEKEAYGRFQLFPSGHRHQGRRQYNPHEPFQRQKSRQSKSRYFSDY